jgi:hypothetical protein
MFAKTSTFNIFRRLNLLGFFISALSLIYSVFISVLQFKMEGKLNNEVLVAFVFASLAVIATFAISIFINKPIYGRLSKILKKLEILNEAELVYDGPMGFQSKAVQVEKIRQVERRSLSGHLPTFLRRPTLEKPAAREIFASIRGINRDRYVEKVNERGKALFEYIKANHSMEIYSKLDLLTYVGRRNLFIDVDPDPVCEILERLEVLLLLIQGKTYDRDAKKIIEMDKGSYEVRLINTPLPVYFLMKKGKAVLFDTRSRSDKFEDDDIPIFGGFYSEYKELLKYYATVFYNLWSKADKESPKHFFCNLKDLIYNNVCSDCVRKIDCYAKDSRSFVGLTKPEAPSIFQDCTTQSNKKSDQLKNAALDEFRKVH